MPKIIGRNRRQYVINVKAEYTDCRKHNPVTGKMVRCDPDEAWALLLTKSNKTARLVESDDRSNYIIRSGTAEYELRKPSR